MSLYTESRRIQADGGTRRPVDSALAGRPRVLYQPIIEVGSMKTVGAEALTRFAGSEEEFGPVEMRIRALERTGRIVEHGRWLHRRCAYEWWKVADRGWRLNLNVSPVELNQLRYADELLRWFPRGGVSLELTETSAVPLETTGLRNLEQLRERGIELVLDDLGEGYNTYARMLTLGSTQVKLSRHSTRGIGRDRVAEKALLEVLNRLRDAGQSVILEGLETQEQMDWARELGCEKAQGYGIAMPMSIAELRCWSGPRRGASAMDESMVCSGSDETCCRARSVEP